MYFEDKQARLVEMIREMVRRGELTERGLARTVGVSQPHLHNILKGIRSLSPEFADQLLRHLGLTLLDLKTGGESPNPASRDVGDVFAPTPLLSGRTGPACFPFTPERHEGFCPFMRSQVAALTDPVAMVLHGDPSMAPRFQEGDLILLERSEACRSVPDADSAYVVETSWGTAVRLVRHGGRSLYLLTEETKKIPAKWEYLSLAGQDILQIIRGRVVWIGRDQPPMEYMGRGGGTNAELPI